jgi:hypothetical protein
MLFLVAQLFVATSPKMEGVTGKYFGPIALETEPSAHARNKTLQRKLWEESDRLVKPYF